MFSRLPRSLALCGRRVFSTEAPVSVPIPTKPKGWPTPWITEEDADNYLFPLYLRGWYISAIPKQFSTLKTAGLTCRFNFSSAALASTFVRQVVELSEEENHHPSWLKLENSARKNSVRLCTTTHSALRPEWHSTDTRESRALEGLTLRDLRFAALVSSLPTSPPLDPSREIEPSPARPNWDDLCATLRLWSTSAAPIPSLKTKKEDARQSKTVVCIACGGPHAISACSTRQNFEPPPCSVCAGPHWRVDCPIIGLSRRDGVTVKESRTKLTPAFSSEQVAPTTPCPNCGGPHWKHDCRQPHAPPKLLEPFQLPVPTGAPDK